jgi:hypothetical protein
MSKELPVSAALEGLSLKERAEHLDRLRLVGQTALALVRVYLASYREGVEVGLTAGVPEAVELHQRAGELRVIRTLEEDVKNDLAVVFPELSAGKVVKKKGVGHA